MKKKAILLLLGLLCFSGCGAKDDAQPVESVDYVASTSFEDFPDESVGVVESVDGSVPAMDGDMAVQPEDVPAEGPSEVPVGDVLTGEDSVFTQMDLCLEMGGNSVSLSGDVSLDDVMGLFDESEMAQIESGDRDDIRWLYRVAADSQLQVSVGKDGGIESFILQLNEPVFKDSLYGTARGISFCGVDAYTTEEEFLAVFGEPDLVYDKERDDYVQLTYSYDHTQDRYGVDSFHAEFKDYGSGFVLSKIIFGNS